ncbi:MAG: hypothetical protein ACE5E1_00110 [Phycisphaerae bacterium]
MAIEFRCEHCNKMIRAPGDAGGRTGKCPHCGGANYIPLPEGEAGELPLVPLDEQWERHRRQAVAEDLSLQRSLAHEKAAPGQTRPRTGQAGVRAFATPSESLSRKQLTRLVVHFIEAMSKGDLEKAGGLTRQLADHKQRVGEILDELMTEDLTGYGLPALPRPVLLGFLKQLRIKM